MTGKSPVNQLPIDKLRQRLDLVQTGDRQWEAKCPAHDDNRASLSVCTTTAQGRTALICCHAGCDSRDVLAKIGLTMADLFTPRDEKPEAPKPEIEATYDYRDAVGELIFQAVRLRPKDFRQRKPKPGVEGEWEWSVKGCKVVPYRLPELVQADPAVPVLIPEGERDVENLRSFGFTATCNSGGAGKWKREHAEFLVDRHVVILPDCDTPGRKHADQVARSLAGKAGSIKVVELPGLPAKGDVSDWLSAGGTAERLISIIESSSPWEPTEANLEAMEEERGPVAQYADLICSENHFARDVGGKLYRYRGGAFRSKGEAFIQREVKRLSIFLGDTKRWSSRFASEVVEFIRVDAPELWEQPPADIVNVENGLLHLRTGELLPHCEKHLSPVQLPVSFDPEATCPFIKGFVDDVFPPDAVPLAWEIPALVMAPHISVQKAVLLLGAGGNGKSTWLAMLTAFLGKVNIAAVTLHRLESDRFSSARLIGKLANVCADLPTEHLAGTSTFKALTGGDAIEAEHKFRDSFSFEPFARLVFSANSPPRSSDGSDGFFDRWLVVPFDARFRGTERELSRQELDARLSSPQELSGLLNMALAAWRDIESRGGRLSEPESVKKAWNEFHSMTDPLSVWLDQFTVDDFDAAVPKSVLRSAYGAACEQAGRPSLTENAFGRAIKKARPSVSTAQRTINGHKQWCFIGIGLRGNPSHQSQESQDTPLLVTYRRESGISGLEEVRGSRGEQDRANPVIPVIAEMPNEPRETLLL